jgi:6-phosphogluconolactonase
MFTHNGFGGAAALTLLFLAGTDGAAQAPKKLRVYVGTYTGGASKGIYRLELDIEAGKLSAPHLAAKAVNPSFLAIHPNRRFLYAVGEINEFGGKKSGAVNAFAINAKTGDLKLLNQQSSGGAGPCHVVVDAKGKNVLVANYGGGSAAVLPVKADGSLEKATSIAQHHGSSVNKQRQEGPHAHSINLDRDNHFAFVADLGLDAIAIYRYDPVDGSLTSNDTQSASVKPGSGPRHFAFHPSGNYAYVINELANTVTAFKYNANTGALTEFQSISTLPADFKGTSYTAEVQVHPSGRFVYASNRGHDSIAIFTVEQATGKLHVAGHQSYKIKTPRNFAIDPSGTYLVAASQDANLLVLFRINQESGQLTPAGSEVDVPFPVCIRFRSMED